MRRRSARLARLLVIALIVGVGISQLVLTVGNWHLSDMGAYWEAAERLRAGEPLYPALASTEGSSIYRYAPWFAWAWVPVTLIPRAAANVLWSIVLLAASAAALWPLAQARAWLAIALFLPILVGISAIGNVQPLLVAALVLGLERRSGPIWVAAAASLKAFPILFTITYIGRREWVKAFVAGLVTVALTAPMLLYDLSNYPTSGGRAGMLIQWPAIYAVTLAGAVLVSLRLARSRHAWLASASTVAVALPRFFVYDVTLVMAALPAQSRDSTSDRTLKSRD